MEPMTSWFAFEVESCPEAFWNTCPEYRLSLREKAGWH